MPFCWNENRVFDIISLLPWSLVLKDGGIGVYVLCIYLIQEIPMFVVDCREARVAASIECRLRLDTVSFL